MINSTQEWFVSSLGTNSSICGSFGNPCSSLKVVYGKTHNDDIIYITPIEGHSYSGLSGVTINHSLHIKSLNHDTLVNINCDDVLSNETIFFVSNVKDFTMESISISGCVGDFDLMTFHNVDSLGMGDCQFVNNEVRSVISSFSEHISSVNTIFRVILLNMLTISNNTVTNNVVNIQVTNKHVPCVYLEFQNLVIYNELPSRILFNHCGNSKIDIETSEITSGNDSGSGYGLEIEVHESEPITMNIESDDKFVFDRFVE